MTLIWDLHWRLAVLKAHSLVVSIHEVMGVVGHVILVRLEMVEIRVTHAWLRIVLANIFVLSLLPAVFLIVIRLALVVVNMLIAIERSSVHFKVIVFLIFILKFVTLKLDFFNLLVLIIRVLLVKEFFLRVILVISGFALFSVFFSANIRLNVLPKLDQKINELRFLLFFGLFLQFGKQTLQTGVGLRGFLVVAEDICGKVDLV